MSGNARYDVSMRLRAVELYEQGCGRDKIASLLGMSLGTVREWLAVYRSVGIEVLAMTGGKHATYSFETKLAAVRAVVDEGMTKPAAMARFGITSTTSLKTWLRAYREGGPDALRPKPKGRHKGTSSPPKKTTREQELERRIPEAGSGERLLKKIDSPEGGEALSNRDKAVVVNGLSGQHPLSDLLECAGLARSSYYYALAHPARPTRPELRGAVAEVFSRTANGCGHRQVAMCLRAELGARIADKTVLKMMREMGIRCGIRRETDYHKYNSYKGIVGETFENVIGRDFSADAPWQKMGTDVTEFKQSWGKAYFAPVYDFGSKEIVAWSTSTSPDMEQQELLLDRLLERMPEGAKPVLHSDMGWQYQMPAYRLALERMGIAQSMSRKGNCLDNAKAENFFSMVKTELYYDWEGDDPDIFERDLEKYIDWYNNVRIKRRLDGSSPVEYRLSRAA